MSLKCSDWKVWKLFVVVTVTAAIAASISSVVSAEVEIHTEYTIEERLARIREQLKRNKDKQFRRQSDSSLIQNSWETRQNKMIQAQWPWNDWSNWADGPSWNNGPWSDWSNGTWSNWSNGPWSDWSNEPWSDWSNEP